MYLTLEQAAKIATLEKGFEVPTADLLRAGVLGYLVICCPLARGEFYNPVSNDTEFRVGEFFVIPPKSLLEIETFGETETEVVNATDEQKTMLFVKRVVKLDQLRVFHHHLITFLPRLLSTENVTPVQNHVPDNRVNSTKEKFIGDLTGLIIKLSKEYKTSKSSELWNLLLDEAQKDPDSMPSELIGVVSGKNEIKYRGTTGNATINKTGLQKKVSALKKEGKI